MTDCVATSFAFAATPATEVVAFSSATCLIAEESRRAAIASFSWQTLQQTAAPNVKTHCMADGR
eukprot:2221905-Prymnesium_polylepis.1